MRLVWYWRFNLWRMHLRRGQAVPFIFSAPYGVFAAFLRRMPLPKTYIWLMHSLDEQHQSMPRRGTITVGELRNNISLEASAGTSSLPNIKEQC